MPYLTAGPSFANVGLTYTATVLLFGDQVLQNGATDSQTNLSWFEGAGLEYAVSKHFNYKLEYLYLDLSKINLNSTYYKLSSNYASNLLCLGINFQF